MRDWSSEPVRFERNSNAILVPAGFEVEFPVGSFGYSTRASHQLRSICLRYFNAAGADMLGEVGENHNPKLF